MVDIDENKDEGIVDHQIWVLTSEVSCFDSYDAVGFGIYNNIAALMTTIQLF